MNDRFSSMQYSRNQYASSMKLHPNGRIMAEYIWIGGTLA